MIAENIFKIGHISLSVALILGSAAVFIFSGNDSGMLFLLFGAVVVVFLRWLEHMLYLELRRNGYK